MTGTDFNFDFNADGEQRSFDVIPDNTICTVQLTIIPGGAGAGGWLTRAKDGNSEHLNCEAVVVDGQHAKRKIWIRYTVTGTNHAEGIEISRRALKAMLESVRGIRPNDESDAAKAARHTSGWQDFDQLRFPIRVGVEPPKGSYSAKNTIKAIITPDQQNWKQPEQIERDMLGKPTNSGAPPTPAAVPANAIARPNWAAG